MMTKRIVFYIQHLLGVGHLNRSALISNELVKSGNEVHVILGGKEIPEVRFKGAQRHHLPAAHASDPLFTTILDSYNEPISSNWKKQRCDILLDLVNSIEPSALLIEHFPFGRRQFKFELIPLLNNLKRKKKSPKIFCSVRDLLVEQKDQDRINETFNFVREYFDEILVHGDPNFLSFNDSFPQVAALYPKLFYTGYVANTMPMSSKNSYVGSDEVIVAAGGGAVGKKLIDNAIAAKSLCDLKQKQWRVLLGPNVDALTRDEFLKHAQDDLIIEPNRSDYSTLLKNCCLSISQGGYNTLLDVIIAKCPALVVPFFSKNETEQSYRSHLLSKLGYINVMIEDSLSPHKLADEINKIIHKSHSLSIPFDMKGAERTAFRITSSISNCD